jgi:hypothetical protein
MLTISNILERHQQIKLPFTMKLRFREILLTFAIIKFRISCPPVCYLKPEGKRLLGRSSMDGQIILNWILKT